MLVGFGGSDAREGWSPQPEQGLADVLHLIFFQTDVTRKAQHLPSEIFADWQRSSVVKRLLAGGVESRPALDPAVAHLQRDLVTSLGERGGIKPDRKRP